MDHPDYSILAARVLSGKIYKDTLKTFSTWVRIFGNGVLLRRSIPIVADINTGPRAILRPDFVAVVEEYAAELDGAIVHARDRGFYLYGCDFL